MNYILKELKKIINTPYSVLIISALIIFNPLADQYLFAQQLNVNGGTFNLGNIREELYVRTDRTVYITGEQLWFKVYKLNSLNHAPWDISKVVYVELLDDKNFPVRQLKVETDGTSGSSGFVIPENISTGYYVLRAYTNWMKNWSADRFFYTTISVVNPFENIDNIKLPSASLVKDTIETGLNLQGEDGNNEYGKQINYTITCQKGEYSLREFVKLQIYATDKAGNPVESDLSVSVAKSDLVNSSGKSGFSGLNGLNSIEGTEDYVAEMEGHLISGSMKLKDNGELLRNIPVSLSFVGKTAKCQFGKTDENGDFYFIAKEHGLKEIVIQPLSSDINRYTVELNQPFSNKFINNNLDTFYIDSSKIDGINNAVVSMQINNIYEPFRQSRNDIPEKVIPDFFDKPENAIILADYIELTSIREVVKEIIPNVFTLKQNGEYDFKLINKFKGQPFENKPLVLVDGVPIYDVERILNIASKEVEKVDVINTRYFFSDNIFDGILSFITIKGNLSALEFDNSIFRQVYETCNNRLEFYSPDYSTRLLKESRIPDFRNTLYWNPDLRTGKDGKAETEFYTSDESVKYTIVVEGIFPDGRRGFATSSLIVKE